MSNSQVEPGTRFKCEQCGVDFEPKNRNGVRKRFCGGVCRDRFKNARRLKAAASESRRTSRPRGPSRHAQAVSRWTFQGLAPVEERAALIRQACANLGITDERAIKQALKVNGCATMAATTKGVAA